MPKEKFWHPEAQSSDDSRVVEISWGSEHPGVFINDVSMDRSAVNRMIRVLRKARDQVHGRDE